MGVKDYANLIKKTQNLSPKEEKTNWDSLFRSLNNLVDQIPSKELKMKTPTIGYIFNKEKNENFISDWLAFLMRNNYKIILSLLEDTNFDDYENEEYEVEREYVFKNGSRIDFLISNQTTVIGIENKIDSTTHANQLRSYKTQLNKISEGREVIQILLKPQQNNAKATNGFVEVTYETLIERMKLISLDFITDLRGSFLTLDFIKHIEENVMKQSKIEFEYNEWVEYLGKHSEKIKLINVAASNETNIIVDYVKNHMRALIDFDEDWSVGNGTSSDKRFIQLYKNHWKQNVDIHFELFRKDYNIIPKQYVIRIDIEQGTKEEKDAARNFLGLKRFVQEMTEIFIIDYSSEEKFTDSIQKIMIEFKNIINTYASKIDEWYLKQK
jgi:hypothetical protein